jgi:hypothetical protein
MPKGANRKIVTDGMFLLQQGSRRHLGKIGKADFSDLREAEEDILLDWDWYNSRLLAEQNAPDQRTLKVTIDTLVAALETALTSTMAFRNVRGSWIARHEFNAAVNDLLREADLQPTYLKDMVEELIPSLERVATIARVLSSTLAQRPEDDEACVQSNPALRADFYRSLHRTLSRHELDTGVGINSLLVELVLNLQGKASDMADPIERRRKDLAREIKLAVKPAKGG